jgi:hypothetical protein
LLWAAGLTAVLLLVVTLTAILTAGGLGVYYGLSEKKPVTGAGGTKPSDQGGAGLAKPATDLVRARQFTLVDQSGKPRIVLQPGGSRRIGVGLFISDRTGKLGTGLGLGEDNLTALFMPSPGAQHDAIILGGNADGAPGLHLRDRTRAGDVLIWVPRNASASVNLQGGQNFVTAAVDGKQALLSVAQPRGADMAQVILNAAGRVASTSASVGRRDGGGLAHGDQGAALILRDRTNRMRVILGSPDAAAPNLTVYGPAGQVVGRLTP